MADRADLRGTSEWQWVYGPAGADFGGSFTFAKGASPEQVMNAFGMNPAYARLLPAARVDEAIRYPGWEETYPPDHPWIRVGVAGDWGFAMDESSGGYSGYAEDAAYRLSAGTEAILFTHTASIDGFHYYANDIEVTSFEPLRAWERWGTEPNRFLPQMQQVGLPVDPHSPGMGIPRGSVIALLEMLTLALGIRLPREVALGPLLTVQRD